jgi:hypothetical protein
VRLVTNIVAIVATVAAAAVVSWIVGHGGPSGAAVADDDAGDPGRSPARPAPAG